MTVIQFGLVFDVNYSENVFSVSIVLHVILSDLVDTY